MNVRALAIFAVAAAMTTAAPESSHAQSVGVRIGVPGFYGDFYSGPDYGGPDYGSYGRSRYYDDDGRRAGRYGYAPRTGPRVYGYVERFDEPSRRISRGGCGTFRYWDGSTCADARNNR